MTVQTVRRIFNTELYNYPQANILSVARQQQNPVACFLKRMFTFILSCGLYQALAQTREEKREREVCNIAIDLLRNLPQNYAELNSTPKVLHTNLKDNYQIIQKGPEILLYTVKQQMHQGRYTLIPDPYSKVLLACLHSEDRFNDLIEKFEEVIKARRYWTEFVNDFLTFNYKGTQWHFGEFNYVVIQSFIQNRLLQAQLIQESPDNGLRTVNLFNAQRIPIIEIGIDTYYIMVDIFLARNPEILNQFRNSGLETCRFSSYLHDYLMKSGNWSAQSTLMFFRGAFNHERTFNQELEENCLEERPGQNAQAEISPIQNHSLAVSTLDRQNSLINKIA